ncbi:MAG: hypothetical protein ACE5JI_08815 [Acidobacteriota bacterium]
MSEEEKTQQGKRHDPFENMPFAEQMRKMMAGKGRDCDCRQMMARMKAACCGEGTDIAEPSESKAVNENQPTEK